MGRVFFSAPHPLFGRKNSRLTESHQQRSPYYWWWAYLRRSAAYLACCERGGTGELAGLYADFGDVREDDFHQWWTEGGRGVRLFAEQPLAVKFGELDAPEDWQPHWDKEQVLVLAVPLNVSKRRLKGVFAKLLDARHKGNKSGRPSMSKLKDSSTARYKVERNYNTSTLKRTLDVYDLWAENQIRPKEDRLTLWEIGKALRINLTAVKDAESKTASDRLIGRNVLGATVGRYVRQAKSMIANAEQGRFPLL